MTRCVEFYQKWASDPNWCGKCPTSVFLIDNYLGLVAEAEEAGIPKKFTMVNLPERAARPLFEKRNSDVRDRLLYAIFEGLKAGQKWSVRDVSQLAFAMKHGRVDQTQPQHNGTWKLLCGPFQEQGNQILDESVSLILTDPPYSREYLDLWEPLGQLSQRVLIPGGYLIAYAGSGNLPEKLGYLSKYLSYYWTFAFLYSIQTVQHYVHIFSWWKPVVLFYKPPIRLTGYIHDIIKDPAPEKDLHVWQQSEGAVSRLIDFFCPQNGLVLDPMAGSGTTLAAALRLGHSCIGIDIDPANIEVMKRRLGNGGD